MKLVFFCFVYINLNKPCSVFDCLLRCNRGWFYHKEVRLWFIRTSNVEPLVKTHLYERGSYLCFDPEIWDSVRKVWSCWLILENMLYLLYTWKFHLIICLLQDNFVLHYELVEKRPALPSATQNVRWKNLGKTLLSNLFFVGPFLCCRKLFYCYFNAIFNFIRYLLSPDS